MGRLTLQNTAQMKTDERERLHLSRTYDAHLPMVKDASVKLQAVMELGSGIWVAGHSILPPWERLRPGSVKNESVRKQTGSLPAVLARNKLSVFSDASRPHSEGSLEKTMHRRKVEKQSTYVHSSPIQYPQPPVTQPSSRPALSSKDTNTALKHQYGDGIFKPIAFVTTEDPAPAVSSSQHLKRKLRRTSVESEEQGRMSKVPKIVIDLTASPDQPQSFNRPVTSGKGESQYQAPHGNVYPDQFNLSSHFPVSSGLEFDGDSATARSTLSNDTSDNQATLTNTQGGGEKTFNSHQPLSAQSSEYIPLIDESPQSATNATIPDINLLLSTFPAFQPAGPHWSPIMLPLLFDDGPFYTLQPVRSPYESKKWTAPPVSHHEDEEEFGKHAHMDRALAHMGEEDDFPLPPSYLKNSNFAPVPGSDDEEEFERHAYMDKVFAHRSGDENAQPPGYLKHSKLAPISEYDENDNDAYMNMHKNNAYMNNTSAGIHEDFPISHPSTGTHDHHAGNDFGDFERHTYVENLFVDACDEEEEGYLDTDADEEEVRVCCTATQCCVCAQDIIACGGHCKCPCYDTVERYARMDRVLAGDYEDEDYPSEDDEYPDEEEHTCSPAVPETKVLTEAERDAYIDRVFAGAPEDFPIDDLDTEAQEEEAGKEFDEVYDSTYDSAMAEDFEVAGAEFNTVYVGRAPPYFLASDAEYQIYDEEEGAEGRPAAFDQPAMHNTAKDTLSEPHSPAPQELASGRDADGYWDGIDIYSPAADYVDVEY